jgi:hypothetical protein
MTQEPNTPNTPAEQTTTEAVSKLLIDRPSDFRFHAAYLIYSSAWDKAATQEDKKKLNEMVEALSKDEIEYDRFYHEINRYRAEFNPEHFSGGFQPRIETQRKRDWRKREEKDRRNARHGR